MITFTTRNVNFIGRGRRDRERWSTVWGVRSLESEDSSERRKYIQKEGEKHLEKYLHHLLKTFTPIKLPPVRCDYLLDYVSVPSFPGPQYPYTIIYNIR